MDCRSPDSLVFTLLKRFPRLHGENARSVILMTISRGNQLLSILVCFARTARTEDCAEIARKCEAGTFSNAYIRLLGKTISASDRIGLPLLREEGVAPTTPTPPKMSWIMSNVVGDGRFPHDFMTRAKELNRETFNEFAVFAFSRKRKSLIQACNCFLMPI